jgi:AraC-like DNA-binding protein
MCSSGIRQCTLRKQGYAVGFPRLSDYGSAHDSFQSFVRYHEMSTMVYIEHKPAFPLRRFVRSLWYACSPFPQHRHERILPSGCAHIVVSLSHDFLTNCTEAGVEQRTAPALMVGQRSMHEVIATEDLIDLAGAVFAPGAVTALVADRADLISNQNLPLDQIWPGCTDYLRGRMLEASSPEARLHILEDCLASHLVTRCDPRVWDPHPAVKFVLEHFEQEASQYSIPDIARRSGWSERRFSQVFREQVGFPPKVWGRLRRFHRVVRQLHAGVNVPWAQLAIDCGFYDQAHFANEFRAFSGFDLTTYTAMPRWVVNTDRD